jgi:hypothetical protein
VDNSNTIPAFRSIFTNPNGSSFELRRVSGFFYERFVKLVDCKANGDEPARWKRFPDYSFDDSDDVRIITALDAIAANPVIAIKRKSSRIDVSWESADGEYGELQVWTNGSRIIQVSTGQFVIAVTDIADFHVAEPTSFEEGVTISQASPPPPETVPPTTATTTPPTTAPYRAPRVSPTFPTVSSKKLPPLEAGQVTFRLRVAPNSFYQLHDNGLVIAVKFGVNFSSQKQDVRSWRITSGAIQRFASIVEKSKPGRSNGSKFNEEGVLVDADGSAIEFGLATTAEAHRKIIDDLAKALTTEISDEARLWAPPILIVQVAESDAKLPGVTPVQWTGSRPLADVAANPVNGRRCSELDGNDAQIVWGLMRTLSQTSATSLAFTDASKNYVVKTIFSVELADPGSRAKLTNQLAMIGLC